VLKRLFTRPIFIRQKSGAGLVADSSPQHLNLTSTSPTSRSRWLATQCDDPRSCGRWAQLSDRVRPRLSAATPRPALPSRCGSGRRLRGAIWGGRAEHLPTARKPSDRTVLTARRSTPSLSHRGSRSPDAFVRGEDHVVRGARCPSQADECVRFNVRGS